MKTMGETRDAWWPRQDLYGAVGGVGDVGEEINSLLDAGASVFEAVYRISVPEGWFEAEEAAVKKARDDHGSETRVLGVWDRLCDGGVELKVAILPAGKPPPSPYATTLLPWAARMITKPGGGG